MSSPRTPSARIRETPVGRTARRIVSEEEEDEEREELDFPEEGEEEEEEEVVAPIKPKKTIKEEIEDLPSYEEAIEIYDRENKNVAKKGSRSPRASKSGSKSPVKASPRKSPKKRSPIITRGDVEMEETTLPVTSKSKSKSKSKTRSPLEGVESTALPFPTNQTMKEVYLLPVLIASSQFKHIDETRYIDNRGNFTARLILIGDDALAFFDQEDQRAYDSSIKELRERSNGPFMFLIYLNAAIKTKALERANLLNAGRIIAETFTNYLNEYTKSITRIDARLQERCRCELHVGDEGIFSMEYDEEDDKNLFAIVYTTKSEKSKSIKKYIFATFRLYDKYLPGNPPIPSAIFYENRYIASLGYLVSQANWGIEHSNSNSEKKMYKKELEIITSILDSGKLSCASISSSCATCYDEGQKISIDEANKSGVVDRLIELGYYPPQARETLIKNVDMRTIIRTVRRIDNILIK